MLQNGWKLAISKSGRRTGAALLAIVLLFGGPAARAQPLISELVQPKRIRAAVGPNEAAGWARALAADSAEQEAAAELVQSARLEVSRAVNRHLRRVRANQDAKASEASMVKEVVAAERDLLDQLRLIAGPTRQEAFERYQFWRRRGAFITTTFANPVPMDLREALTRLKVDIAAVPGLAEALDRYERELDAALVARQQTSLAYLAAIMAPYDKPDPARADQDREAQQKALRESGESEERLARTQVGGWRTLTALLDPAIQDQLGAERVGAIFAQADQTVEMNIYGPDTGGTAIYREVLALGSLTDQQRADADRMLSDFRSRYAERRRAFLREYDDDLLKPLADRERSPGVLNRFSLDRTSLRAKLDESILAILTPQQRTEYDESPVLFEQGLITVDPE